MTLKAFSSNIDFIVCMCLYNNYITRSLDLAYLSEPHVRSMGFKAVGNNVLISTKSSIYDCNQISIGNNVRIDDFCLISGNVNIASFVHLAPYVMLAGGKPGISVGEYVTFAYGVKVFAETDDYQVNPLLAPYCQKS